MRWRVGLGLVVLLGAGVALWAATRSGEPSEAVELQKCVDRWNWMRYDGLAGRRDAEPVKAKVEAHPCRIEVPYLLAGSGQFYFPCRLNRYGAYVCHSHAAGAWDDPPRAGHNARYIVRTGALRLDQPPTQRTAAEKPEWVRRYTVDHGYIVPFDDRGRLRAGLTLRGPTRLGCTTFEGIAQRTKLLGCGAGLECFVPRLPVRDGQLLACPVAAGARLFERGRLTVLPDP